MDTVSEPFTDDRRIEISAGGSDTLADFGRRG